MRIKNKEIADILGISTTAVSLAINNRPGVSESTRQKVMQLLSESFQEQSGPAKETSEPDGPAAPAAPSKSILLSIHKKHGLIIDDKPFFSNIIETVQLEAMKRSYVLTLAHYMPGQDLAEYINYIKSLNVDGIILMATEMDDEDLSYYQALPIPLVLMDAFFDLADVDTVALDNQSSILRAFRYAYQMGHRDIGFLKSSVYINNFGHRFDGFLKSIRDYGLEEYNHPVISLPCKIDGAYSEMKRFLANPPEGFQMPTLFLADLDYIAFGAMQALKEFGYKIPDDISIIGYDDVAACEIFDPPLTTVRCNRHDIGRISFERLIDVMSEKKEYYTTTHISSELVVRGSVKKLDGEAGSSWKTIRS